MARDPNIPDAFDVYTVVVLRRPEAAPEMPEQELDALQTRHLAYRAELARKGVLVANGPFAEQSDPSYRGMSVFACDAAEAARLSDGDPSVAAGRARARARPPPPVAPRAARCLTTEATEAAVRGPRVHRSHHRNTRSAR